MAATPSSTRRSLNTRGSVARNIEKTTLYSPGGLSSEPPLKKRRYIPGGPGGGGRYIDSDGHETPVGGGGPGGYNYIGSRGRVGRENAANGVQPVTYSPRPRRESRRERAPARPRFSSAAAAAAAVAHGDGFKPREERGWEEFHQDLDVEAKFFVFSSYEVDGIPKPAPKSSFNTPDNSARDWHTSQDETRPPRSGLGQRTASTHDEAYQSASPEAKDATLRRRSSRSIRRTDSMLKGIGTPEMPKLVPTPGFNPREKLMLPKPSFRWVDPFEKFEEKGINRVNYVDKSMANIGYQESEIYVRPENSMIRVTEGNIEDDLDVTHDMSSDGDANGASIGSGFGRVEYDMDEQDTHWLEALNEQRTAEQYAPIKPATFEATMTKIEKEWYALEKRIPKPNPKPPQTQRPRSSSAAAVNGELTAAGEEQDTKCAICDDGDCENTNAIVFCDGCDLAVHQECYGVPFIPEGQWLCRKCQLIGRGTPTCIFCPNTDGAFKQTNASRWSHLLCAIWIPEVSIGNPTFMEPVMDVEKVPKPRWKLTCYICRQKMGACIQCGNKNCYIAFHVTCARRARLFLKMKSTHGGPTSLDASVLKAYCDKHVPTEWRREQDVDTAIVDTMDYYRRTMRGRLWADSQQAALTIMPAPPQDPFATDVVEDSSNPKITLKLNTNSRNRQQPPKIVWRLPSGAPVIPQALYNAVENALGRAAVSKRKEFAAEMCKYWTLKREARRGAALLKRLQLQMEPFTSLEITRRNFVGMGAAGGVRLQRRIDFADSLLEDVEKLKELCGKIKERERQKLEDANVLKQIVDTVYFPVTPLLWPILQRAKVLDGKGVFEPAFLDVQEKLSNRQYTSVGDFRKDLFAPLDEISNLSSSNVTVQEATANTELQTANSSQELKQKKALAKRIMKAAQTLLVEALYKESELRKKPSDQDFKQFNRMLDGREATNGLSIKGLSISSDEEAGKSQNYQHSKGDADMEAQAMMNGDIDPVIASLSLRAYKGNNAKSNKKASHHQLTPETTPLTNGIDPSSHDPDIAMNGASQSAKSSNSKEEPPTPPLSTGDETYSFPFVGIPWYMDAFDPDGTTIHEEYFDDQRGNHSASDDLSDIDEDELSGLVEENTTRQEPPLVRKKQSKQPASTSAAKQTRAGSKRKKRYR